MRNGNGIQRPDFAAIAEWVRPGSRVLDLGCGDGTLLGYLKAQRDISGTAWKSTTRASSPASGTA